jgi:hypothetical protein
MQIPTTVILIIGNGFLILEAEKDVIVPHEKYLTPSPSLPFHIRKSKLEVYAVLNAAITGAP